MQSIAIWREGRQIPRYARDNRELAALHSFANIEQDLEVELFTAIGEIQRRHLRLVAGSFGTVERLAVHLVKVAEDSLAGAGHADLLEGVEGQTRQRVGGWFAIVTVEPLEQIPPSRIYHLAA